MAFSFQPKTVTDGLVLYLDAANVKSYPGSGTTWTDLSSTATSASLINSPSFSSLNAGAIVFDGINDYGQVSHRSEIMPTAQITFGAIFKITDWSPSVPITVGYSGPTIISKETFSSVSVNSGYLIRLDSSGSIYFRINSNGARIVSSSNGTIQTGSVYHTFATFDGTNVSGYVNGVLVGTTPFVGTVGSSTNTLEISRNFDGYRVTGSIYQVQIYNRALSATEVLQNYNAICGRFGKTPTITDGDALSFVNAANISNETQQSAINTLVTDLKGAGLWSKMKAIYPFVGGTAASHKWNLKDPRDVDAAFRLTFSGGWTHSSTGADPNGTNAYSNTFLVPNTSLTNTSTHLSIYLREDSNGLYFDIGSAQVDSSRIMDIYARYLGNALGDSGNYTISRISVAVANSLGFYNVKRTANNNLKLFKNGIEIGSNTSTDTTLLPTANVYISAALPGDTNVQQYSPREVAFATIGDGLTDTDAANLYTIVQKYQTTLGRQV
jgi:hypothetical protein